LTENAAAFVKDLINFDVDLQMPQRKVVELGRVMSRVASMDMVLKLGDAGFRSDLVNSAVTILRQEITSLVSYFSFAQPTMVVEGYDEESSWFNLATI